MILFLSFTELVLFQVLLGSSSSSAVSDGGRRDEVVLMLRGAEIDSIQAAAVVEFYGKIYVIQLDGERRRRRGMLYYISSFKDEGVS